MGNDPWGLLCLLISSLNQSKTNWRVGVGNSRLSLLVLFLVITTFWLNLKGFSLQVAQPKVFFFL